MRTGILEPNGFSPVARARLERLGPVEDHAGGPLDAFLADKTALFVRLGRRIDDDLLSRAPGLRFVVSPTTGHTHLDLGALSRREIRLISLAGERSFLDAIRATPEHTLGLILALLRNYRTAIQDEHNAHWDRDRCRGEEVAGARFGLIGFGRVGQRVAHYLAAMDGEVHWHDPGLPAEFPSSAIRHASIADLIRASEVVVLAASYTPDTPPILGRAEIALLEGRRFVNTARGELVDEAALLDAIEAGRLAGVAVDVIADEQGTPARARWLAAAGQRNVIVTPHIAGATWRSMRLTEEFVTDRLIELVTDAGRGNR